LLLVSAHDLSSCNTLHLPSHAASLVRFDSARQLAELSALADRYDRLFVLGGGSNVVLGQSLAGLVIKVESRGVHVVSESSSEIILEAQAGESWHGLVARSIEEGWPGLENLALIPGTVGAAPVQNIGAYGVELDQRLHSVTAWNLRERRLTEFPAEDCGFSYRDSFFKREPMGRWLIVSVRLRLPKPWAPVLSYPDLRDHPALKTAGGGLGPRQVFEAVCDIRRRKLPDPAVLGNAGSFFKNPVVSQARHESLNRQYPDLVAYPQADGRYKLAAGWMIDRAGWKGRRMGPVGVHERQALVLVNHGGATAADIERLAGAIRDDVLEKFGVLLEQEPVAVN